MSKIYISYKIVVFHDKKSAIIDLNDLLEAEKVLNALAFLGIDASLAPPHLEGKTDDEHE